MAKGTARPVARRQVLGLGGAAAAGLAMPAVATAQAVREWRMASPWPRGTPGLWTAAQRLAASITAVSAGRLKVVAYPAGELAPAARVFDAVATGAAELGHGTAHYWPGKEAVFQFFAGIPFGLTAHEHAAWIRFGGGQDLWDRLYRPHGVRPFLAGNSGPQGGGWFRREIRRAADFSGMSIRMAGLGGDVLQRLGATIVEMPASDILPALQAGTLDAAEWIGPWNDLAFGFHRYARYYYLPAFHEPGAVLELLVNAEAFEQLDADLKQVVGVAAAAASAETLADFTHHNAVALELIQSRTNAIALSFPDGVIRALGEATGQLLQEIAASSPLAGQIHQSYRDALTRAVAYASAVDRVVLRQRQDALK